MKEYVGKMKIAALACSNGLGHSRRVIAIASFMLKNGFNGRIDAYLPKKNLVAFENWPDYCFFKNHSNVKIFDFYYPIVSRKKTEMLYNKDWESIKLPKLKDYDVVWSDNILQVLPLRPDSKITGSFLWHEVFEKNERGNGLKSFVLDQKELLKKYNPQMAGSEYFATDQVKKNTQFFPVGLYKYSILLKEKKNKSILLSCGLGGEEELAAKNAVKYIIEKKIKPPQVLYIEPRLLPKKYPDWIKEATFTSEMFHDCVAVCIRPGMGTISDALVYHSRIFAFSRDDSYEMIHNSKILSELGVGEKCKSPIDAYLQSIEFASNDDKIKKQYIRTAHLRTDGVFATSNFILK